MKFLLQVDNYDSYLLATNFRQYQTLLAQHLNLRIHYKIFKNAPLNQYGYIDQGNPNATKDVTYIGKDYYFVVKHNTFEKTPGLFGQSLRQMCLFYISQPNYYAFMELARDSCFEGPDSDGNFKAVNDFTACLDNLYQAQISNKSSTLDEVVGFLQV